MVEILAADTAVELIEILTGEDLESKISLP
jgi:hypothetical protein